MPPKRRPVQMDESAMKESGVQTPEETKTEAPLLHPEPPAAKSAAPSPAKPMVPVKASDNKSVSKSFSEDLPSWMEGEFTSRDKGFPLLSIFQKDSPKYGEDHDFKLGDLVYDSKHRIGRLKQDPGVFFVLTHYNKFYQEEVEYDSGKMPRKFETKAEADAAGAEVREAAFLTMLVNVPDGISIPDAITLDGCQWIETGMFVSKTSYKPVSQALFKAVRELGSAGWKCAYITTDRKTKENNIWAIPVVTFAENLSNEWKETLAHING